MRRRRADARTMGIYNKHDHRRSMRPVILSPAKEQSTGGRTANGNVSADLRLRWYLSISPYPPRPIHLHLLAYNFKRARYIT